MDDAAIAQMVNERIAQQIGQMVISLTQAQIQAQADAMKIAELTEKFKAAQTQTFTDDSEQPTPEVAPTLV